MSHYHDVLLPADIEYILSLPEVLSARERIDALSNDGSIQFKITLTTSLRSVLLSRLNLNLENINEIPMRWIKGDTMPHVDRGKSDFNDTYLVYLNDSEGQFILEDTVFPIKKNTGFVFNEGLIHKTENTGSLPRLLLGPMNELAEPVGHNGAIFYYSNKEDADNSNQPLLLGISTSSYVVGNRDSMFDSPIGIAIDASGIIYVADGSNFRIRKILPNGTVSTFSGSGIEGYQDGPAGTAQFDNIRGMKIDISGNLYLSDGNRIRKILPNGTVTTLAGTESPGYQDGPGESASFGYRLEIEVDANGNIYVVDRDNYRIRKILPNGTVSTIAGTGNLGYQDGPVETASFEFINGITLDDNGNIYVSDFYKIRKILPNGTVTTIAGSAESGHQDGPVGTAVFNDIGDLHIDSSSNLYVLEYFFLRKLTPDGTVSTIAGSGTDGYEDGPGEIAKISGAQSFTFDVSGNIYIADGNNHRIRKVIPNGTVSTIAGSANYGFFNTDTSLPTHWKISSSSTGSSSQTVVWNNGQTLDSTGGLVQYNLYPLPSAAICFLEGTTVLCLVDYTQVYLPIEQLTSGVLVKTLYDGYKKIELLAKEEMNNPGTDERIENRLYKCSTSNYPELKNDLFITGCHSILVDTITDKEKEELTKQLGRIFVTDKKYRLTACADKRAEPWNSEGKYTIWHLVLEHENPVMNYGIYVNGGLLVESCSKHIIKNKSNMIIQ